MGCCSSSKTVVWTSKSISEGSSTPLAILLRESTAPSAEIEKVSGADREQLRNQLWFSVFIKIQFKKPHRICIKPVFAVANPSLKRDTFEYSSLDEDRNATPKNISKLLSTDIIMKCFPNPDWKGTLGTGFTLSCQVPKPPDLKLVPPLLTVF